MTEKEERLYGTRLLIYRICSLLVGLAILYIQINGNSKIEQVSDTTTKTDTSVTFLVKVFNSQDQRLLIVENQLRAHIISDSVIHLSKTSNP